VHHLLHGYSPGDPDPRDRLGRVVAALVAGMTGTTS
jgi:hypothetical protein